jgi:hypothetical protein
MAVSLYHPRCLQTKSPVPAEKYFFLFSGCGDLRDQRVGLDRRQTLAKIEIKNGQVTVSNRSAAWRGKNRDEFRARGANQGHARVSTGKVIRLTEPLTAA